jgi:hypothetical protein
MSQDFIAVKNVEISFKLEVEISVADPGCLTGSGFFPIPDPKKHGEVKKKFYICFLTFL